MLNCFIVVCFYDVQSALLF